MREKRSEREREGAIREIEERGRDRERKRERHAASEGESAREKVRARKRGTGRERKLQRESQTWMARRDVLKTNYKMISMLIDGVA